MDKFKFETPDMTAENMEKIAALFPGCITEMRDELCRRMRTTFPGGSE